MGGRQQRYELGNQSLQIAETDGNFVVVNVFIQRLVDVRREKIGEEFPTGILSLHPGANHVTDKHPGLIRSTREKGTYRDYRNGSQIEERLSDLRSIAAKGLLLYGGPRISHVQIEGEELAKGRQGDMG